MRVLERDTGVEGGSGSVGILLLDPAGSVDLGRLGDRRKEGAPGVGSVLGAIAAAISGSVVPKQGNFLDATSDLSTDDIARFAADLEAGEAGVAVLARPPESEEVIVQLTNLGGKTEVHHLTRAALRHAESIPPAIAH